MTDFLSYNFEDTPEFIDSFDELPLWSAPFGLLLLDHIPIQPQMTVLDIGSGAGFPLLELASRLGSQATLYGIDPWVNANMRAKMKIRNYALSNVSIIENSASTLPFAANSIDLVTSNLGINNFDNPKQVFDECLRILKPGGRLALTTNLNGHWTEFYRIFEATLRQLMLEDLIPALRHHEAHRGTTETVAQLFRQSGFTVSKTVEDRFNMRFLDGSAFLNHHFVKPGWVGSWKALLPEEHQKNVLVALETNLNIYAKDRGELLLTVPMLFMEGTR